MCLTFAERYCLDRFVFTLYPWNFLAGRIGENIFDQATSYCQCMRRHLYNISYRWPEICYKKSASQTKKPPREVFVAWASVHVLSELQLMKMIFIFI